MGDAWYYFILATTNPHIYLMLEQYWSSVGWVNSSQRGREGCSVDICSPMHISKHTKYPWSLCYISMPVYTRAKITYAHPHQWYVHLLRKGKKMVPAGCGIGGPHKWRPHCFFIIILQFYCFISVLGLLKLFFPSNVLLCVLCFYLVLLLSSSIYFFNLNASQK